MKLYVWRNVLNDYTSGVMFALAESEEQARELVREKCECIERNRRNETTYICIQCRDSLIDPDVYETPIGFAIWGGG